MQNSLSYFSIVHTLFIAATQGVRQFSGGALHPFYIFSLNAKSCRFFVLNIFDWIFLQAFDPKPIFDLLNFNLLYPDTIFPRTKIMCYSTFIMGNTTFIIHSKCALNKLSTTVFC